MQRCFTGNETLINLRFTRDDNSVHRNAVTGLNSDKVTGVDSGQWKLFHAAIGQYPQYGIGPEGRQIFGKRPGPSSHSVVQVPANEQKKQQHDCRIKVGVFGMLYRLHNGQSQGQNDPDADRNIHVEHARSDGVDCAPVERHS